MRKTIKSRRTSTIPDEILEQILIRLPHLRSAIQCKTVCKKWQFIISSSNFKANFVDQIQRSNPPLRLLLGSHFNFFRRRIRINQNTNTSASSSSSLLIPKIAGISDSFHSNLFPPGSTLLAICNDLLLVRISGLNYCICNPLTGQKFSLPPPPNVNPRRVYIGRCGLVLEPPNNNGDSNTRYRVMIIYHTRDHQTSFIRVYFSETGEWLLEKKVPDFRSLVNFDVVASNGFLYWIAFELGGVITLNLVDFEERWVCCEFPDPDYRRALQFKLGLFKGQPRLSQLHRVDSDSHHLSLKVWDLIYTNGFDAAPSWLLVHQVVLNFEAADVVFVLGFHPSHSDQIFMLHNSNFYQYDVKTKEQIVVAEIHYNISWETPVLPVFPFVLPAWPTQI